MTEEKEDHAIRNARAWLESIAEALEAYHKARGENGDDEWGTVNYDGEELTADGVQSRIEEMPLSVEFRTGWRTLGDDQDNSPTEYKILLSTGGPALRIIGQLDYGQPASATIQWQDWGTLWTDYRTTKEQEEQLIEFARFFYFGE